MPYVRVCVTFGKVNQLTGNSHIIGEIGNDNRLVIAISRLNRYYHSIGCSHLTLKQYYLSTGTVAAKKRLR